jgi:hypothetical protein
LGANLTNLDAVPLLIHEFGYHPRTLNPDGAPPKVFETRTGDDAPSERLEPGLCRIHVLNFCNIENTIRTLLVPTGNNHCIDGDGLTALPIDIRAIKNRWKLLTQPLLLSRLVVSHGGKEWLEFRAFFDSVPTGA